MAKVSPLVSVIVPVYNVDDYINHCIESIVNQTHANLEIILVDDSSTDQSGKFCDIWARKDKRITVIHKKNNEGLFRARVTGFEEMKGLYFLVVDSDDYIKSDYVENFLNTALKTGVDIIASRKFIKVDSLGREGYAVVMPAIYTESDVFTGFMKNLSSEVWGWCVWNKMYKTSIYSQSRDLILPIKANINTAEDVLFSTIFARATKTTKYLDSYEGYYYRQNVKSITRDVTRDSFIKKLLSIVDVLVEMEKFMIKSNLLVANVDHFTLFKNNILSNYVWGITNEYTDKIHELLGKNEDLVKANAYIEIENTELKNRVDAIVGSKAYKTGRIIAAPYTKARRMIK